MEIPAGPQVPGVSLEQGNTPPTITPEVAAEVAAEQAPTPGLATNEEMAVNQTIITPDGSAPVDPMRPVPLG